MNFSSNLNTLTNNEFDSTDDCVDYFSSYCNSNGFKIFQVNFRSVQDLHRLDLFKYYLSLFPYAFDIIVLSESWIQPDKVDLYSLDGYDGIFRCRESFAGGLVVYIKSNDNYEIIENYSAQFFNISISNGLLQSVITRNLKFTRIIGLQN